MNKSELVEALAAHYDGSRADATRALNAFVQTVSSATAGGERVAITGFGVFERVERPARTVRNPRTGERLDVPATAVPRFRPGTELKAYVSGQRAVPELGAAPAARRSTAPVAAAQPVVAASAEVKADKPKVKKDKAKDDKAKKDEKPKAKGKSDKKSKGKKK
jgi:DNA-binding protein HU-beta